VKPVEVNCSKEQLLGEFGKIFSLKLNKTRNYTVAIQLFFSMSCFDKNNGLEFN
jgi:hypothetical protein